MTDHIPIPLKRQSVGMIVAYPAVNNKKALFSAAGKRTIAAEDSNRTMRKENRREKVKNIPQRRKDVE